MVYHNFIDFNIKLLDNYNELLYFKTSSEISGSHLLLYTHQINIEMNFNFHDFFNRYTILKIQIMTVTRKNLKF